MAEQIKADYQDRSPHASRIGKAVEQLVAASCILLTDTKLNVSTSVRARVLALVERELDGTTPPLPPLTFPIESTALMEHREAVGRRSVGLTMWTMTINGQEFTKRIAPYKTRIFDANVRGFLGIADKTINRQILTTIEDEPHHFVFANNGITMVCSRAVPVPFDNRTGLEVHDAQIVNGQQTTRVLEEAGRDAQRVSVLVRVIAVPDELRETEQEDGDLSQTLVRATNRQNRVSAADLKSNDRKQIWLEQELAKLRFRYVRKRQAQSETASGPRGYRVLRKEWLARAVASCETDTLGLKGKEPLFEQHYRGLFSSSDPWYYAGCYLLFDRVQSHVRKSGERTWARFCVTRFLWKELGQTIRRSRRSFVTALQQPNRYPRVVNELDGAIQSVFAAAVRYYRKKARVSGREREDVQRFFKRAGAYEGFESFWRGNGSPNKAPYRRSVLAFAKAIRDLDG